MSQMPQFDYTARDGRGRMVTGMLAAASPELLVDQLRQSGLTVTAVREKQAVLVRAGLTNWWESVSKDQRLLFSMELAKMVEVGIPLLTALRTLANQGESSVLRRIILDVATRIESGASLSDALRRHPRVFNEVFISLVRAGEASGKLDEVLRRLSDFSRQKASLHQQLVTALVYPCFLLVFGLGIMVFLVMGLIPKFMVLFIEAEVPLPTPTRVLYAASQMMQQQWLLVLLVLAACLALVVTYARSPVGHAQIDAALLRIPVIGSLVRQVVLSRLSRTFQTLVASGVPMLDALQIVEQACGNRVIARVVRAVHDNVKQGGTISEPLAASPHIPPMMAQMISVGEASGTVDQMLHHLADYFDERVQHGVKRVTAFVEPVFLIAMGAMVAFILASVLLPLFSLVSVAR